MHHFHEANSSNVNTLKKKTDQNRLEPMNLGFRVKRLTIWAIIGSENRSLKVGYYFGTAKCQQQHSFAYILAAAAVLLSGAALTSGPDVFYSSQLSLLILVLAPLSITYLGPVICFASKTSLNDGAEPYFTISILISVIFAQPSLDCSSKAPWKLAWRKDSSRLLTSVAGIRFWHNEV